MKRGETAKEGEEESEKLTASMEEFDVLIAGRDKEEEAFALSCWFLQLFFAV